MHERRGKGDDAIYFGHDGPCKDSARHSPVPGKMARRDHPGAQPAGQAAVPPRVRADQVGVQEALKNLRKEIDGITEAVSGSYTVRRCWR